jgi:hypothetical protein
MISYPSNSYSNPTKSIAPIHHSSTVHRIGLSILAFASTLVFADKFGPEPFKVLIMVFQYGPIFLPLLWLIGAPTGRSSKTVYARSSRAVLTWYRLFATISFILRGLWLYILVTKHNISFSTLPSQLLTFFSGPEATATRSAIASTFLAYDLLFLTLSLSLYVGFEGGLVEFIIFWLCAPLIGEATAFLWFCAQREKMLLESYEKVDEKKKAK